MASFIIPPPLPLPPAACSPTHLQPSHLVLGTLQLGLGGRQPVLHLNVPRLEGGTLGVDCVHLGSR